MYIPSGGNFYLSSVLPRSYKTSRSSMFREVKQQLFSRYRVVFKGSGIAENKVKFLANLKK
jgi:hypothetical protein